MREMVGGCCVCSDDRGWSENPLVYCDGQSCNVAVHQGNSNKLISTVFNLLDVDNNKHVNQWHKALFY